ncbi:MAG: hypothetical protein R6X08_10610 [Desulfosalsimonadaceae bacterium]
METKRRNANFDGKWKLPLLPDYIMRWADITPENDCIVFADTGRRKFVIKPKGYLVFPDEVTDFLSRHPKISEAQVVGVPHRIYDDGVFAFVKPRAGESLSEEEVLDYCKNIASYKRPLHVAFWPEDQQFPLNKTGKVDAMALIEKAQAITEELRQKGGWDAS